MGDEHLIALQAHRFDHLVQFRPGSLDEGASKPLLLGTWCFAHEHERGISGSLSEDDGVFGFMARTVRTSLRMVLLQSRKTLGLRAIEIEKGIIDDHGCDGSALRARAWGFSSRHSGWGWWRRRCRRWRSRLARGLESRWRPDEYEVDSEQ